MYNVYTCICVHIHCHTYKEIYYEELVSVVMETEKSQDQLSASWGPRRADLSDLASRQEKNPQCPSWKAGRQKEFSLAWPFLS